MSECVVRMEMPKCCFACPCLNGEYGYCQADKEERQIEDPNGRPSWCPILCQLPDGHGRLVDADAIEYVISENGCKDDFAYRYDFNELQTIVPAEAERKVYASDAVTPTDTPTDTPTVPAERSET